MTAEQRQKVVELNDLARTAMGVTARVMQTPGISSLDLVTQSRIRERVERFDQFTRDNDPHGEHDFGAFEVDGFRVFWKIDYYDREMQYGSEEPWDVSKTRRVLTIMLASEY